MRSTLKVVKLLSLLALSLLWIVPFYRDVAPRLRGMMQSGRLKVKVTNDDMGGDPAVDIDKKLRVIYDYRGDRQEKVEDEGHTLEIP